MARVGLVLSIFCFSFISYSSSLRHRLGQCPTVTAKPQLNMTQLAGSWTRYAKYGFHVDFNAPLCIKLEFNIGNQNKEISMVQKKFRLTESAQEFKLIPVDNNMFTKQTVGHAEINVKRTFTILDTDYKCWAATFECKQTTNKVYITYSEIRSMLLVKKTAECLELKYEELFPNVLARKLGVSEPKFTYEYSGGCKD